MQFIKLIYVKNVFLTQSDSVLINIWNPKKSFTYLFLICALIYSVK